MDNNIHVHSATARSHCRLASHQFALLQPCHQSRSRSDLFSAQHLRFQKRRGVESALQFPRPDRRYQYITSTTHHNRYRAAGVSKTGPSWHCSIFQVLLSVPASSFQRPFALFRQQGRSSLSRSGHRSVLPRTGRT